MAMLDDALDGNVAVLAAAGGRIGQIAGNW